MNRYRRLGEILTDAGVISQEQLSRALELQKQEKKRLGTVLMEHGFITEADLIRTLHLQLGIDFIDLSRAELDRNLAETVPEALARKHRVIPLRLEGTDLVIAMEDPLDFMAVEALRTATRRKVLPVLATREGIRRAYNLLYESQGARRAMEQMEEGEEEPVFAETETRNRGPVVRLVDSLLERAVSERASDIHVEPGAKKMQIRIRVDGRLVNIMEIPGRLQMPVIARLKIMGGMDVVERRLPQDGQGVFRTDGREIDLRFSSIPAIYGEHMVIRLLYRRTEMLSRKGIGLEGENERRFQKLLEYKSGVILIAGPTGSGKSSTMYTMLEELNREELHLVLLEDPVEYKMAGITQVPINEKAGMTFAHALRSVLRQDPDVIGIGEIRDQETAEIAMRAAMTGHLVISTIHTEDAISALDRLRNMGVDAYLIAGTLRGVLSQRLVRKICPSCRRKIKPEERLLDLAGIPEDSKDTFYTGDGCPVCLGSGYWGRTGVFEILLTDKTIRDCIAEDGKRAVLRQAVKASGFLPMMIHGIQLAREGVTSLEELCRTVSIPEL